MKNLKIMIFIVLVFVLGAFATNLYASSVKLIMVPEYIGRYKTIDLLQYMADIKTKEEIKATDTVVPEVTPTPEPSKGPKNKAIHSADA